jgi:acetyl esterase/lipase
MMASEPQHVQNSEWILEKTPPAADERVSYGSDPNQFIEVRLPKKPQGRCVVFIHGGFWRARYNLTHAGHACAAFKDAGWTSINVEYRRVGNEGGAWPGTFSDLRSAMALIFSSARKWNFDAEKLVVMGHSAGGQLAMALAAHDQKINYAVSLAGVLDLRQAYELHLSNDAVVEFLGGTPAQVPEHYKEASPIELSIKANQLVVHGRQDDTVPYSMAESYTQQKGPHERIELLSFVKAGHFELVDPKSAEWKQLESATAMLVAGKR